MTASLLLNLEKESGEPGKISPIQIDRGGDPDDSILPRLTARPPSPTSPPIMAIVATNLKRGQCIQYEGERGVVLGLEHRTPGKGNALIAATIRSFKSGKTKTIRFASSEKVDIVETDRQKLEFSYAEPGTYHFMDPQTFDTIGIDQGFIGDAKDFIKEGQLIEILFIEGNPVSIDLPDSVELEITESSEGIKGDTANNPTKPAVLETGLTVQVPLFVKQGEVIKVSTKDSSYLGRA